MGLPNLWAFDVETTLNAPEKLGKAHPMWPDNRVVVLGVKYGESLPFISLPPWGDWGKAKTSYDFIVGCNLSFDLLYLYKENPSIKKWLQKQRLWDIQLVEYLLSGQQSKWASLDEMSVKYGLPVKDDRIKREYFDKGLGADKVPRELLDPYLIQDVTNTEAIALKQMEEVTKNNMMDLVVSQMEALHCTTEMMFNGLAVDRPYLETYAGEVATEYADCKVTLQARVNPITPVVYYPLEDVGSATQWGKWLFGGV